jgi:hypothetical protein
MTKYMSRAAAETQLRIARARDRRYGPSDKWSYEREIWAKLDSGEWVIGESPDDAGSNARRMPDA